MIRNLRTAFISSPGEIYQPLVFLEAATQRCSWEKKGVLKICCKFAGEDLCRSVISIKLQSSFIEITLRHGCSPVNLLHICRKRFLSNTYEWLLLYFLSYLRKTGADP